MKKKESSNAFNKLYPNIADWVESHGWIEIGYNEYNESFVRALDIGGMIWEGESHYESLDAAMQDLEAGIAAWMQESF